MSKLPDLGSIPRDIDKRLRDVLEGMREHIRALRGFDGRGEDIALSENDIRTIVADEMASLPGGGGGSSGSAPYVPDFTEPPTPSGVTVIAGMAYVTTETDAPTFTAGHGYDRTVVYGAQWPASQPTAPTFSDSVPVDEFVGDIGSFPTKMATRWCIWVKWRTKDGVLSSTAAGGANGLQVTTGQDVNLLLQVLNQQITTSQLYQGLANDIALSRMSTNEAAEALLASVVNADNEMVQRQKVAVATANAAAAIVTEAALRVDADAATLASAQTYTASYAYSKGQTDTAISTYTYSKAEADTAIASSGSAITARLNAGGDIAAAIASAQTYAYTKAQTDSAISSSASTLSARLNTGGDVALAISAAANAASNAQTTADGKASASSVTTLQAQVAGTAGSSLKTSIEEAVSTSATVDGYLGSQYTVRASTTQDGRTVVGGFGLSSTSAPGAGATIDFGVRADKFWIGAPSGSTGVADIMPFVVQTADTTVNGVLVPKGVYMDAAYIKNVTAIVAQLGNAWIDTAKIADAAISTAKIGDGQITTAKIANAQITTAKIADAQITSAKIADANITTAKIADANITNAKIGGLIQSSDFDGTTTGGNQISGNGTTGWAIAKGNGTPGSSKIVVDAAHIRGQLSASQIQVGAATAAATGGGTYATLIPSAAATSHQVVGSVATLSTTGAPIKVVLRLHIQIGATTSTAAQLPSTVAQIAVRFGLTLNSLAPETQDYLYVPTVAASALGAGARIGTVSTTLVVRTTFFSSPTTVVLSAFADVGYLDSSGASVSCKPAMILTGSGWIEENKV